MSDLPDIIIQNANQRTTAPKAVGIQVLLMLAISTVTVVIFNILRPANKIIYEPKVKYHVGDKAPPRISDSTLGWLPPLIHTKEPELVDKIGLDATTFLRFVRMQRWMLTAIALLCCATTVPVNAVYNMKYVPAEARDILSMLTIRDVRDKWLFVHAVVSYAICAMVCSYLWFNWRAMVRLRNDWFRSPEYQKSFYARTLMITEVSKKYQSDEGIRAIFESMQVPYPTTSVHVGRKVGDLPELLEFHNDTVRELEQVLVRYLKDGKIAKERPMYRIGGFMGCGGRKVDAIDFYTAKLKRTEAAVERYRDDFDTRKAEPYGFASMAAVPYAHIVANLLRNKKPKGTKITLAPNPKDLIWSNLNLSQGEIISKRTIGWVWLIFVAFVNTIPLFVLSVLANLTALSGVVPFLEDWNNASPGSFAFVSGVLPPLVSAIFGFALPHIFRWLSKYQGAVTHSRLDRAVIARYFGFIVASQLVIFTLLGVLISSVQLVAAEIGHHDSFQDILNSLNDLPKLINRAYIDQSSYWLTYFPLRGFLAIFDLAQIANVVWITIKKRLFGRTPREIREWTQPPEFQYAIYYSNLLFMSTVALVFAPLAPLVAVAGAVVFWLSSWVYKYQLMFVYVSRVETGGRMWNVISNRMLISLILMQALFILTAILQFGWSTYYWVIALPPILFVFGFKLWLHTAFHNDFVYHIPGKEELEQAKIHSQRADNVGHRLSKRFGHPALTQDLFTPMVHANCVHLLQEIYSGKIENDSKLLAEYGGQKMDTHFVQGIRIAAVNEHDLEYDPRLYQRDRGELDWDTRSITSTAILDNRAPTPKSMFHMDGRSGSPAPSTHATLQGYEKYMAQGQHSYNQSQDYEMTRFDAYANVDRAPLLTSPPSAYPPSAYGDPRYSQSVSTLGYIPTPISPTPQMPQSSYFAPEPMMGSREAPVHRPQYNNMRSPSSSYSYPDNPPVSENLAGRGASALRQQQQRYQEQQ